MRHLTVVEGSRPTSAGESYWLHPVHGVNAVEAKAAESVAQCFAGPGEPAYAPRWALDVLTLAVDGNPKAKERAGDALEVLSAHLSIAADDASPYGIVRPLFDDDGGVA